MSGIAAALSVTGDPLDTSYFRRWARSLEEIGPDSNPGVHCTQQACLAHAPLHVYAADERRSGSGPDQPATLGEGVWIVADARLDALDDLLRQLRAQGRKVFTATTDAELILHAYAVWGSDCMQHLIGDFAFALWDESRGRLLTATDHFGVRPLYYARTDEGLLVSNWGAAVYVHRGVDRTPDDAALTEFMSRGYIDSSATAFRGIRVLPHASRLIAEAGAIRLERYWTLPVDEPLLYPDEQQYVDHFRELLQVAVADRLRGGSAAVFMSGGLDSPAVVAAATSLGAEVGRITAHTSVWESLIPDDERGYATAVAEHLGIPVVFHSCDDYLPFSRCAELAVVDPMPVNDPFVAGFDDQMQAAAASAPVVLTGHGTDAILAPESLGNLVRSRLRGQLPAVLRYAPRHFRMYGRRPTLGILPTIARLRRARPQPPPAPPWLLRSSPDDNVPAAGGGMVHPFRSDAYRITAGNMIPATVASFTAMARWARVNCAHPFLDLRVVRFCLQLPPVPLCWDKHLIRVALRGLLPGHVVTRPKTPVRSDPLGAAVRRLGDGWLPVAVPGAVTSRYYAWPDFVPLEQLMADDPAWVNSRPITLELFVRAWSHRTVLP